MKAQSYAPTRYLPFGDTALLVEFGEAISLEVNRRVIALNDAILKAKLREVEELVPTYRSLLVRYNPLMTSYERLSLRIKEIEQTLTELTTRVEGSRVTVPVVYGGEYGPDLKSVARCHGLTQKNVVKLHSERDYRVYMIGFVAGFPYLGEVADEIATPRLETPRLRVPAGSVGIAEKQTGIYPCDAPGGWQIIGRTPMRLFNPRRQPPATLRAGDTVRFEPISKNEFKKIEGSLTKSSEPVPEE
jgi:inhibitor of KinA